MKQILMGFLVLCLGIAVAEASTLRVTCDDSAVGAEISINGKYKGECPIDIQVNEGKHSLKAVRKIDGKDSVFKDEIRIGDGVTKRVEVSFGASTGTSTPAAAIRVDQNAIAQQRYAVEMEEYNRSIQSCLPKYSVEKSRLKNIVNVGYKDYYQSCVDKLADYIQEYQKRGACGSPTWDGTSELHSGYGSDLNDAYRTYSEFSETSAADWCESQFTKPKAP